ncbi:MAG: DUF4330 family protein [Clostridia bacterium]|nr:DUF4330 family protein [Clostridia bacterium]
MSNSSKGVASLATKKEKGKNGRFNLIDLILVVLVLLVIAVLIQVFSPFSLIKKLSSNQTKEIQYTIEISGVDAEFIDRIKEDDLVIDSISKNNLGKVVTVSYNTYSEFQYVETDEGGEGVLSEHPNKFNLLVTISTTANYAEGSGYSVNATRIAVGEKLALRFPDYVAEGYCIYLETE